VCVCSCVCGCVCVWCVCGCVVLVVRVVCMVVRSILAPLFFERRKHMCYVCVKSVCVSVCVSVCIQNQMQSEPHSICSRGIFCILIMLYIWNLYSKSLWMCDCVASAQHVSTPIFTHTQHTTHTKTQTHTQTHKNTHIHTHTNVCARAHTHTHTQ